MKFLIIRFSSIGDIVLTTPVIRCLKQQLPGAEVHFLSKQAFGTILRHNPYIDKLHLVKEDIQEILPVLKSEGFDYIIDLHHNLRSWRVKRFLNVKSFSFDKLNVAKFLRVWFKINRLSKNHIVDRYLETVSAFNIKNDNCGLDYFLASEDKVSISNLPDSFHDGFNSLVLGGSYFTKRIPLDKLEEICSKSPIPLVLLGGQEEKVQANHLAAIFKEKVYIGCGKFTLNQSASIIQQSQRVFTSDTGMMHIAAAFKKDIISFWGNTIPEFGMTPYLPGPKSRVLEVKNLSCRPCSKLGFNACPKKHFRCMNDIRLDESIFQR
jgi:ADP-heptose:LPS heptosyltransferase